MSRIGKQIIEIPQGVTVQVTDGSLMVKGPKGEIKRDLPKEISINIDANKATVDHSDRETQAGRSLWGTFASHLSNMIQGVTKGYEKTLIINGVGYGANVQGQNLVLTVGFSHPVNMEIPQGVSVESKKDKITISGHDKEVVGQFASNIKLVKPVEPYKGHGIHYEGEYVIRKQGKRATT